MTNDSGRKRLDEPETTQDSQRPGTKRVKTRATGPSGCCCFAFPH